MLDGDQLRRLLSSQNHAGSGAGAECGHYSTVTQNRIDSSWYHVDSYIAPASHLHLLYHKTKTRRSCVTTQALQASRVNSASTGAHNNTRLLSCSIAGTGIRWLD
jgi:hypothetical protein